MAEEPQTVTGQGDPIELGEEFTEEGGFTWELWQEQDPMLRAALYVSLLDVALLAPEALEEGDLQLLMTGLVHDTGATSAWKEAFDGVLTPDGKNIGTALDLKTLEETVIWPGRDDTGPLGESPGAFRGSEYSREYHRNPPARIDMYEAEAWARRNKPYTGFLEGSVKAAIMIWGPGKVAKGLGLGAKWVGVLGGSSKAGLGTHLFKAGAFLANKLKLSDRARRGATAITGGAFGIGLGGFLLSATQAVADPESSLQLGMAVEDFQALMGSVSPAPMPRPPFTSPDNQFNPIGSTITTGQSAAGGGVPGGGVPGSSTIPPGTSDLEDELALSEQDPWIGYENPVSYLAQDETGAGFIDWPYPMKPIDPTYMGDGPEAGDLQPVPFRYRSSDIKRTLADMSPGQIIAFQVQAVNAGLIDGDFMIKNKRTLMEEQALTVLMHNANSNGTEWQTELNTMEQAFQSKPKPSEGRTFVRNAYLEPDYATLAQYAKTSIRQRLGREINDWELSMLADEMKGLNRMEFDAGEEQRLETWRAEGRAMDDETNISEPADVQAVDSGARFQEFFDSKFGAEATRREGLAETHSKSGQLMSGIQRMADMMGGG